jgi:RNA polymerase sigma-70 factor (ECF subfamily)
VRRYVDSIVRDHHDTEDVTQSVFLRLASMVHTYQPRDVPFAAWLTRVARNAAVDCLRARRVIAVEEVRVTDNGRDQGDARAAGVSEEGARAIARRTT